MNVYLTVIADIIQIPVLIYKINLIIGVNNQCVCKSINSPCSLPKLYCLSGSCYECLSIEDCKNNQKC